jgi:hypothetical protein
MIPVVQLRRYGKVHITTESYSWPGYGICDLVYKHEAPSAVSAGRGSYQVGLGRRGYADWWWDQTVRTTKCLLAVPGIRVYWSVDTPFGTTTNSYTSQAFMEVFGNQYVTRCMQHMQCAWG